jgi:hypothetical protein
VDSGTVDRDRFHAALFRPKCFRTNYYRSITEKILSEL